MQSASESTDQRRPISTRVKPKYIEPDASKSYDLDGEYSQDDPGWFTIWHDLSEQEFEVLFEHMRHRLRSRRVQAMRNAQMKEAMRNVRIKEDIRRALWLADTNEDEASEDLVDRNLVLGDATESHSRSSTLDSTEHILDDLHLDRLAEGRPIDRAGRHFLVGAHGDQSKTCTRLAATLVRLIRWR